MVTDDVFFQYFFSKFRFQFDLSSIKTFRVASLIRNKKIQSKRLIRILFKTISRVVDFLFVNEKVFFHLFVYYEWYKYFITHLQRII